MTVTPPDEVRLSTLSICLIVAENVERQRLATARDVFDDIIDVLVSQNRHDRPENLLLHDLHVRSDIGEHRRMDRAVGSLQRAANGNFGALINRIIEEPLDAGEIPIIDDLRDVFLFYLPVFRIQVLLHPGSKFLESSLPSAAP